MRALWRCMALGLFLAAALAIPTLTAGADTLIQGFKTKTTLQPGWVVAISKTAPDSVELASAKDPSRIYGVVIDPSNAPVTLHRQNNQVFVATDGNYEVLVSTQNGAINVGDYLALSSIDGIASRASDQQTFVLGKALQSFDGVQGSLTSDKNGFALGRIKADISHTKNPLLKDDVLLPQSLRRIGAAIAGKGSVSPLRIYTALAALIITTTLSVSILWIGVRGGMVALGRNPLSQHSIFKGLVQVTLASILIFIIGLFGVYLLLRL